MAATDTAELAARIAGVHERVPAHLITEIHHLERMATPLAPLILELDSRLQRLMQRYYDEADHKYGDRAPVDCDPDDRDDQLEEVCGLDRLHATMAATSRYAYRDDPSDDWLAKYALDKAALRPAPRGGAK